MQICDVYKLVFHVCKGGLHLYHVCMAFLPKLFLSCDKLKGLLSGTGLAFDYFAHVAVIDHIAVCLYGGKANLVSELLFAFLSHFYGCTCYANVVYGLETVEQGHFS